MLRFTTMLFIIAFASHTHAQECKTGYANTFWTDITKDGKYIMAFSHNSREDFFKVFDATTAEYIGKFDQRQDRDIIEKTFNYKVNVYQPPVDNPLPDSIKYEVNKGYHWFSLERQNFGKPVTRKMYDHYYEPTINWNKEQAQGLMILIPEKRDRKELYLLKGNNEPLRLKQYKNDYSINFFYTPDGRYVVTNNGMIIDMQAQKLIVQSAFAIYKNDLPAFNADNTLVAAASDNGLVVVELATGKIIKNEALPVGLKVPESQESKAVAMPDMEGYTYGNFRNGAYYTEVSSWLVRNGKATLLCDPQWAVNKKAVDEGYEKFVKNYGDGSAATVGAADAYATLLSDIAALDRAFEPYGKKILEAGKDAWILYGSRQKAVNILLRMQSIIRSYIRDYGSKTSKEIMDSLRARLKQVQDTYNRMG